MELVIIFAFVSAVALALGLAATSPDRPVGRRLARLADGSRAPIMGAEGGTPSAGEGLTDRIEQLSGGLGGIGGLFGK